MPPEILPPFFPPPALFLPVAFLRVRVRVRVRGRVRGRVRVRVRFSVRVIALKPPLVLPRWSPRPWVRGSFGVGSG